MHLDRFKKEIDEKIETRGSETKEINDPEIIYSPPSEISSGGGSGSGGSSTNQENFGGCSEQQISYGLKNLETKEECLAYEENNCVSKKINCSINVVNLDARSEGVFIIRILVYTDSLGERKIFGEENVSSSILPMNTIPFSSTFSINGSNTNLDAECAAYSSIVPKKKVCN